MIVTVVTVVEATDDGTIKETEVRGEHLEPIARVNFP
jgi:hypothetical protein